MAAIGLLGVHDVGGTDEHDKVPHWPDTHKQYQHWERATHALLGVLSRKQLVSLDEHRRAVESLPAEQYNKQSYYERWASGIALVCIERGVFTKAELDEELGQVPVEEAVRFHNGDIVKVRDEAAAVRWRKPHLRAPGYIHGRVGVVEGESVGLYADPEALAFAEKAVRQPLYRVRFFQRDVWEGYRGSEQDTVVVEIYQAWLLPSTAAELDAQRKESARLHRGLLHGSVEHGASGEGSGVAMAGGEAGAVGAPASGGGEAGAGAVEAAGAVGEAGAVEEVGEEALGEAGPSKRHKVEHTPHEHHHHHKEGEPHHHHHDEKDKEKDDHDHEHHHDDDKEGEQHEHEHHHHEHEEGEGHGHEHHHHHHGDGGEPHVHEGSHAVESKAVELEGDDTERRRFPEAVARLLDRKGAVTGEEVRKALEVLDSKGEQRGGARIVARAWVDPAFKARLLEDGNAAAAELGLEGSNWPARKDLPADCKPKERYGTVLTAVENTPSTHNLIVCTLCSCYPLAILGMSPSWYKSRAYRARAVRDPRGVLAEMGLQLPADVAVKVHDSTADSRYLVLPERPAGTEGWSEEQLARLVTRDSMIGVAKVLLPSQLQA